MPDTLICVVEPDWTQMRESEAWPVRIEATFVDSYGTTEMNDFAEWLDQLDAPGPTRRLTHFRDRVMTFAFPADADPAAVGGGSRWRNSRQRRSRLYWSWPTPSNTDRNRRSD
jgi:hypothetical protein